MVSQVGKQALGGNATDLINDVQHHHCLSEGSEVKFPPTEVDQRQETVEEFKRKAFDYKRIVVGALVFMILTVSKVHSVFAILAIQ